MPTADETDEPGESTGDVVRTEDHGSVRVLVLDRPPANAIDESLLVGVDRALADIEANDEVRAVVVTGAGRFFCGGFDLMAPRRDGEEARRAVSLYRDTHRRLFALPKPTVALVNGHAIAGGFVIALACDVRIAVDTPFKIGLNEVAIGASFPAAAAMIVRARLTAQAAAEVMLGAELYDSTDGIRLGAFDHIVPAAGALDDAVARAAKLGSYPREVFAHTKASLIGGWLRGLDEVSMDEELATSELWRAPESRAARAAQRQHLTSSR